MSRITAFVMGGLVGAGIALAFAPRTGQETRSLVVDKANAFAGEAKDFAAGMPGTAQDAYKVVRDQGSAFVSDAATKVREVAGMATDPDTDTDELREKIEAARKRIASQVMENAEKSKDMAADMKDAVVEAGGAVGDAVKDIASKADDAKHAK